MFVCFCDCQNENHSKPAHTEDVNCLKDRINFKLRNKNEKLGIIV